jgi:hypothetical protein
MMGYCQLASGQIYLTGKVPVVVSLISTSGEVLERFCASRIIKNLEEIFCPTRPALSGPSPGCLVWLVKEPQNVAVRAGDSQLESATCTSSEQLHPAPRWVVAAMTRAKFLLWFDGRFCVEPSEPQGVVRCEKPVLVADGTEGCVCQASPTLH